MTLISFIFFLSVAIVLFIDRHPILGFLMLLYIFL